MLTVAVWAIFFGIVFAVFYTRFQANIMSDFIAKLLQENAFNESEAKNLTHLGFTKFYQTKFIKSKLESSYSLSKIIHCIPESKTITSKDNEITLLKPKVTYKYYILQENSQLALDKYKKDDVPFWKSTLLIIALLMIACLAVSVIRFLNGYSQSVFTKPDTEIHGVVDDEFKQNDVPDSFEYPKYNDDEIVPDTNTSEHTDENANIHPVIPTPDNNY